MVRANILLIMTITASGLSACGGKAQVSSANVSRSPASHSAQPLAVRVFDVVPSVASGDLVIPAALSVEGVAVVTAQRDGAIAQLRVQEGTRVSRGQVIARLSGDDDLRAQLRQAEFEVNRLKVEQGQFEALIKLDRNELNRAKLLAKDGLISQSEVERAEFKLEAAVLELDKTRVATQAAQAKVEGVKDELKKSEIRAPVSGLVTRRYVEVGSSVAKNEKLFEVSPTSPLQVRFQLPQTERARVGLTSLVGVSLVEGKDVVASARVRRIQPVADAASNTVGYVADLIGARALMPGLAVNVRVPRSVSSPNLLVPASAFPANFELRRGTATTLFVLDGNKCAVRSVWINSLDGDLVEVVSGLTAGDRVILSPPTELKAGDVVDARN
ncbi:MAG TPA: efflux RND transporter periplasmic adaptor subunit [Pyrinomonadaceae bacterium]|nr:efflux RND transporter periplasmic adaptor subunit [Pyrinomonadaceae bacterium]